MYFLYLGRILSSSGIVHRLELENGKKIEVGDEFLSRLVPADADDKPQPKKDYDPTHVPGNKPLSGGGGGARAKATGAEWQTVTMVNPNAWWPRLMTKQE